MSAMLQLSRSCSCSCSAPGSRPAPAGPRGARRHPVLASRHIALSPPSVRDTVPNPPVTLLVASSLIPPDSPRRPTRSPTSFRTVSVAGGQPASQPASQARRCGSQPDELATVVARRSVPPALAAPERAAPCWPCPRSAAADSMTTVRSRPWPCKHSLTSAGLPWAADGKALPRLSTTARVRASDWSSVSLWRRDPAACQLTEPQPAALCPSTSSPPESMNLATRPWPRSRATSRAAGGGRETRETRWRSWRNGRSDGEMVRARGGRPPGPDPSQRRRSCATWTDAANSCEATNRPDSCRVAWRSRLRRRPPFP